MRPTAILENKRCGTFRILWTGRHPDAPDVFAIIKSLFATILNPPLIVAIIELQRLRDIGVRLSHFRDQRHFFMSRCVLRNQVRFRRKLLQRVPFKMSIPFGSEERLFRNRSPGK
jgi:hypothetical protein